MKNRKENLLEAKEFDQRLSTPFKTLLAHQFLVKHIVFDVFDVGRINVCMHETLAVHE